MKYLEAYRRKDLVEKLAERIKSRSEGPARFMEVCGGHTMTLHKYGLPDLLPGHTSLISGPGCPVCVSGQGFIGALIELASMPKVTVATYGDLMRIPVGHRTLEKERASGADIRVVYSVSEALALARANSGRKIIFAGIGFETTAPLTAAAILAARSEKLKNFLVYSSHKTMPPALERIASDGEGIDGFIAPGHVSAISGTRIYEPLAREYGKAVVVAGFEPVDLMLAILMLTEQLRQGRSRVENGYKRVVRAEGNPKAQAMMSQVFEPGDDHWRGLGNIAGSGLRIRTTFSRFDASAVFGIRVENLPEPAGCLCGLVITGKTTPRACPHFGKTCTPETPIGACMVSSEGTCSVWHRYHQNKSR